MNVQAIKEAIMHFARRYEVSESFKAMASVATLPELVKAITYEMFLNKFERGSCTAEDYKHYAVLHEYCELMRKDGFIYFD